MSKVALITGASRGIGREIALRLARKGFDIVVASKSIESTPALPGTIFSVCDEIRATGQKAVPLRVDVRSDDNITNLVHVVKSEFGRLDVLVNNAGALWWRSIADTPPKKYDLIHGVNARASFVLSRACLPLMKKHGGHIIMQSPPFPTVPELRDGVRGKAAYMSSKLGMTITAMGIAGEFAGTGIACNTLWPMTPVESYALKNFGLGDARQWRTPEILTDAVAEIVDEDPRTFTGHQLVDEDYLRTKGYEDFARYRCVAEHEPMPLRAIQNRWQS